MSTPDGMETIPQPPRAPLLGNLFTISRHAPIQTMIELARRYGPIYSLDLMGKPMFVVSGVDLVNELCDQKRFDKSLRGKLGKARRFVGDGLFTANTDEPNWRKAHNILLPNFSKKAMQNYHPLMVDIASQLVLKWSRLNADDDVDVVRDMTALTLDTIGLCGFGYRFNSFYRERNHPFVQAMVGALDATMRARGLPKEELIFRLRERRLKADIRVMNSLVDRIIKDRRAKDDIGDSGPDLLGCMLSGVDRESGERLDDINIRYQIITFLIAGHETTSGLLSFAIYYLLQHPDVMEQCTDEVDRVLGRNPAVAPTYAQVNQLNYASQVLKETLRLSPTAPAFGVMPREDTLLGGRYAIKKGAHIAVLLHMLHRDKAVWGERAEAFDPGNFSREAISSRPEKSYLPFGNGQRACIGQQFAMHEATLVLGMILQRFELIGASGDRLKLRESLTIKPDELKIKIRQRAGSDALTSPVPEIVPSAAVAAPPTTVAPHDTPLLVLYGSNMGTSEELARQIAGDGATLGFATTLATLDDYAGKLPSDGLVLVVTASYNGTPPDNAVAFCGWLKETSAASESLSGIHYSVFGCGNRDWAATYQAIPRHIDEGLADLGAVRLLPRGEGDAKNDFDGQFRNWYRPLWAKAASTFSLELDQNGALAQQPAYAVEIRAGRDASGVSGPPSGVPMVIAANHELQHPGHAQSPERSTRHIEIELPEETTYRTGDHFGVVPRNDIAVVRRVGAHFGFEHDTLVRISRTGTRDSFLPVDEWISVYRLLGEYLELQDPATRTQIRVLAGHTQCPDSKARLLALSGEDADSVAAYKTRVLSPRKSLIDLLEEFPACALPFNVYLEMLAPLTPRYYSISSSPLLSPRKCSLTVAVVDAPARSGHGSYKGVCSNYLARLPEGGTILGFVKDTKSSFRLLEDPSVPLIMAGAGTGLAPFRGFLQERAALASRGRRVGRAMLFFGCRHPARDFIYEKELRDFAARGIAELHTAFSRLDGKPKTYVQDRILELQNDVWAMIESGAHIYVCGDAAGMAVGVRQAFITICRDKTGWDSRGAEQWLDEMTAARHYLVDVWSSG